MIWKSLPNSYYKVFTRNFHGRLYKHVWLEKPIFVWQIGIYSTRVVKLVAVKSNGRISICCDIMFWLYVTLWLTSNIDMVACKFKTSYSLLACGIILVSTGLRHTGRVCRVDEKEKRILNGLTKKRIIVITWTISQLKFFVFPLL